MARVNALIGNTFLRIRNTVGFNLGWAEVNAVYLDDQLSQQYIIGNQFIDSDTGVLVNGGRDVVVTGNSFQNCSLGVRYANPGMTVQADWCVRNSTYTGLLVAQLLDASYLAPPYATEYPGIVHTMTVRAAACCACCRPSSILTCRPPCPAGPPLRARERVHCGELVLRVQVRGGRERVSDAGRAVVQHGGQQQ